MNKISRTFNNSKNLIPYICAGDPDLETTKKLVYTLDEKGADIIELGIPFSDPLADGPVIQAAGQRALKNGINLKKIISLADEISSKIEAPLVLMGYYNSILKYGKSDFIKDLVRAGIAGVIIPDLPFEEDPDFFEELKQKKLSGILLAAPNTPDSRLQEIGKRSSGFLYCVSLLGVTGDKKGPFKKLDDYITRVRKRVNLPLALGFGIDGPQKAERVSKYVDGIIIGSAIINIINKYKGNNEKMLKETGNFIKEVKEAILN